MSETATKHNYTATFILDTRNYQEPIETLIDSIKATLESEGAEVSNVENLGQKEFIRVTDKAYPAGIYVAFQFSGPGTTAEALKEKFRLDKTVNRILVQTRK